MARSESSNTNALLPNPVDVIIPVYGGLEETIEAIESAGRTINRDRVRLIVINDASPEPKITAWLRENRQKHQFMLIENSENLGFVGTVNRGMQLSDSSDVILLNSDVEVANDWVERLQATAYSRQNVASVTATANNATICSFPAFCKDNELVFGLGLLEIDQCFRRVVPPQTCVEIPSAVGCCMYIRRDALNAIGFFDVEAFGRGYGEENDWSQRAIKQRWVNLHALDVFVYHKGGVSFAAESDPRKQANLEIVNRRHPNYANDVQRFISEDPAATWRLRVLLQLIGELEKPCSLAISHGLGGGVKSHILELVREVREIHLLHIEPLSAETVRLDFLPGTPGESYLNFRIPQDYRVLLNVLKGCGVSHVHFHHTMNLPTRLWGLGKDLDCPVDYTLHDFWVLNGNPTQTDEAGRYVGTQADTDADTLCQRAYPLPRGVTPKLWRENQLPLMEEARYLICPSIDTMRRISSANEFRSLKQWVVSPHLDHGDVADTIRRKEINGRLKVVAIGALSREKGADLLEATAIALKDQEIEFHLLGYAYRELDSSVITHGPYPEQECESRLLALEPDVVWCTARWPETYSYTLSSALRTGLPVVAPRIGAFPERLAGRLASVVVSNFDDLDFWQEFWRNILANPGELFTSQAPEFACEEFATDFYKVAYLEGLSVRAGHLELSEEALSGLLDRTHNDDEAQGRRERLLSILLRLRGAKSLSWFVRLIPFKWQRAVKRFLSREPMHELK